jgi:hypothetical protein
MGKHMQHGVLADRSWPVAMAAWVLAIFGIGSTVAA